ncbi:MAG: cytochrome c biogenesis protein ResB [Ornithinimicrobium sp.]
MTSARSVVPEQDVASQELRQPTLGPLGWLRWVWRQLTSMRTALMLLLLLAVAAIPGSIWPQRSVDPALVSQYLRNNPTAGRWLDRLQMFDVFSSPWFASIYLLLMISLVGCLLPRSRQHWAGMRAQPPAAPKRLERLPAFTAVSLNSVPLTPDGAPDGAQQSHGVPSDEELEAAARHVLKRHRYRVRPASGSPAGARGGAAVAAETGYLKETGNLIFHIALLGVIVSVGVGHLWGWRAELILPEETDFTSSAAQYDTFAPGPMVDENSLSPFQLRLDSMTVTFETQGEGVQFGAPREFSAHVTTETAEGESQAQRLAVNEPVQLDGASIFLLGNGYAPVVTVRDAGGEVLFSDAVPFLPQDDNYTSTGAIKVTGAQPELGFYGAFLPTARFDPERGPTSDFPDLVNPQLALGVYEGDLFPGGVPQSVYVLDTAGMEPVLDDTGDAARLLLVPGQTQALPGGRGTVTLDGVVRWGGLVARHDPGRLPVLISAISVLVGLVLMLGVRRRRVFVRIRSTAGGEESVDGGERHTGLEVAALVKGSDPGLQRLVERLAAEIVEYGARSTVPGRHTDMAVGQPPTPVATQDGAEREVMTTEQLKGKR